MRCCSGGPSAPELAAPAQKKMSVADSFAGFADSMASIASLPAEAQKDMIEYVRDLRELLAGGMLTGATRHPSRAHRPLWRALAVFALAHACALGIRPKLHRSQTGPWVEACSMSSACSRLGA